MTIASELPSEFGLDEYRLLLEATIARFPVRGADVITDPDVEQQRFCLIRHDIDMSPSSALEVATVEADLGVTAVYAVLLTGRFYNPFERGERSTLLRIVELGHDIALHFDAAWHGIEDAAALDDALQWEAAILSRLVDRPIDIFSFHNTTPFTMGCRERTYGGLLNLYAGVLQDHVEYVSDSNGVWRFRTWGDALAEATDRLQVLTHPEWWAAHGTEPADKTARHIEGRAAAVWDDYLATLRDGGRENRSTVPEATRVLSADGPEERRILRDWLVGRHGAALDALERLVAATGSVGDPEDPALAARFDELALRWEARRDHP